MHFAHGLCDLEFDDTTNEGATFRTTFLLIELNLPPLKACGQKPLASNLGHPPYGYNSHRSRLGRDNGPKLFRKTNIANDVAGALHPIGGRFGPDTVELFTFVTLSDFRVSFGICKEYADASLLGHQIDRINY